MAPTVAERVVPMEAAQEAARVVPTEATRAVPEAQVAPGVAHLPAEEPEKQREGWAEEHPAVPVAPEEFQ